MKRYNQEIMRYQQEAEDRYDNYDEEDDFDTGLDGQDEDSYDEEEDSYDGYYDQQCYSNPSAIGQIDPNDRTLTITVKNTGAGDAEAIVFGANENPAQPAGVTVTVAESSHNEVKEESKANPFVIVGMKMSVSDNLQFDNVLRIMERSSTGMQHIAVYQPRNATSPQNYNANLIDDGSFSMKVTGRHSLRLLVKAGVTAVFTFTLRARANMGNVLVGANVAEQSRDPRTTGLPQIDMMQQRPAMIFGRPLPVSIIRPIAKAKKTPVRRYSPPPRRFKPAPKQARPGFRSNSD